MGFKDFIHRVAEDMREAQKPENIKKKLQEKIEREKLKNELDKVKDERRERQNKKQLKIGLE